MDLIASTLPQALRSRGVSRREFVKFCNLMVATLASTAVSLSGRKSSQSDDASCPGLARISGLRWEFRIHAPHEQSHSHGIRSRPSFLGISRIDYGRRGQAG
jgi:hypothetical protein